METMVELETINKINNISNNISKAIQPLCETINNLYTKEKFAGMQIMIDSLQAFFKNKMKN